MARSFFYNYLRELRCWGLPANREWCVGQGTGRRSAACCSSRPMASKQRPYSALIASFMLLAVKEVFPEQYQAWKRMRRPPMPYPKVHISLRLAADVVERLRASGRGYNGRVEKVLPAADAAGTSLRGGGAGTDRTQGWRPGEAGRRDAMMLAQTLRAGQLSAVWVPDEAHEAMRDLVRLRTQAMRDLRKSRQQLLSFLLRHGCNSPFGHWTKMHRRWLGELVFAHPAQHLALQEMLQRIERAEALCDQLKRAILELVPQWSLAPVVQAIQALRGVSLRVAAVIFAEVGCFGRFESPRALMAYLGLNPSEHSSGATIRRGAITKTGNTLARTCLVEAA
jgi:transposase